MTRAVALLALVAAVAAAAAQASPPPGASAQCRDGTYSYSRHHSGTCSRHGGVAAWFDSSSTGGDPSVATAACGVERWTVKTLQDRPSLLPRVLTTIHFLVTRPAPSTLPSTRLPFEHHVFSVTAAVILVRQEQDGDLHLVLQAGADHMIAEAASPSCDSRATPLRRKQMSTARGEVRLCAHAQVTGVAFFDFDHGQTGVAPNAIELHPILSFHCS
jgi:Protein of unknown function (DUF3761)